MIADHIRRCSLYIVAITREFAESHNGCNEMNYMIDQEGGLLCSRDHGRVCNDIWRVTDADWQLIRKEVWVRPERSEEEQLLHVDLSPVKALVSLRQRRSNNFNQVQSTPNTYCAVYPEDIRTLQKDHAKLRRPLSNLLKQLQRALYCNAMVSGRVPLTSCQKRR